MGSLRREEVRRLLKYLRERIDDQDQLAQIEDELSGEFAEEFIREPEILAFFPQLSDEFFVSTTRWELRVIPHAHLRMIQRGMKLSDVSGLFRRFLESSSVAGEVIIVGGYVISGRPRARAARMTLRVDVDSVTDEIGQSHVVTMYLGRGDSDNMILIDFD
jgi:hypothetical protein